MLNRSASSPRNISALTAGRIFSSTSKSSLTARHRSCSVRRRFRYKAMAPVTRPAMSASSTWQLRADQLVKPVIGPVLDLPGIADLHPPR
jgi:hypothetical protein